MLSKAHHPEKLQDTFAIKHWIQTTSVNVPNSSYMKRRRKLYQGFAVNTLNLKNTFRKDCRHYYSLPYLCWEDFCLPCSQSKRIKHFKLVHWFRILIPIPRMQFQPIPWMRCFWTSSILLKFNMSIHVQT